LVVTRHCCRLSLSVLKSGSSTLVTSLEWRAPRKARATATWCSDGSWRKPSAASSPPASSSGRRCPSCMSLGGTGARRAVLWAARREAAAAGRVGRGAVMGPRWRCASPARAGTRGCRAWSTRGPASGAPSSSPTCAALASPSSLAVGPHRCSSPRHRTPCRYLKKRRSSSKAHR